MLLFAATSVCYIAALWLFGWGGFESFFVCVLLLLHCCVLSLPVFISSSPYKNMHYYITNKKTTTSTTPAYRLRPIQLVAQRFWNALLHKRAIAFLVMIWVAYQEAQRGANSGYACFTVVQSTAPTPPLLIHLVAYAYSSHGLSVATSIEMMNIRAPGRARAKRHTLAQHILPDAVLTIL